MTRLPVFSICIAASLGAFGFVIFDAVSPEIGDVARNRSQATVPQPVTDDELMRGAIQRTESKMQSKPDRSDVLPSEEATIARAIQHAQLHTDWNTRLAAIAELGHLADPNVVLTLRNLLNDSSIAIREEAIESLGELDGNKGVEGLAYALSDEISIVRQTAIENLADLGSEEAVAALASTLNDRDPDLRVLAIEELYDIGSETAIAVLQRFTSDEDRRVRELALEHLADY